MEYKLTFRNHISALSGLFTFTIILIITVLLIAEYDGYDQSLLVFFGVFYLLNLLPVLFIHFQYYNANKNTTLFVELEKSQFTYKTNLAKTIIFSEIERIDVYMLPSLYRGSNFQMMPYEGYHYAIIYTQNEKIIVTSLIVKNIVKELTNLGLDIRKHKCFFPYIK